MTLPIRPRFNLHRNAMIAVMAFWFGLAGCSNDVEQVEREYEMAERNGANSAELCRRGRAVEEAYLKAQREEDYKRQKLYTDVRCNLAELGG